MTRYTVWACGLLAFSLAIVLTTSCESPSAPAPLIEEPNMKKQVTPTLPATMPPAQRVPALEKPDTGGQAVPLPFASPIELAVYDLAKRLGVDADDVVVMDIQEMALPAADLGCPGASEAEGAPAGMVQGQEIVLAVGSQEYVYRAHGWRVLPCQPAAEFSDVSVAAPTEAARQDLAQRLAMKPEEIAVQSVEAVAWPDASLGCPQPGMMYAQVITPGYRILLRADGKTYEYHSDRKRAILCQPQG